MPETPSYARRVAAVGVGAFALWQFIFLPAANLMNFVPRRPGPGDLDPPRHGFQEYGSFTDCEPLQRATDLTGAVLDFWAELSGEEQGWKMFVPGPPSCSHFLAIEVRYPDGSMVEVRSPFEPTDLRNPAPRPPLIHDRLYNFENAISQPPYYCTPDALAMYPDGWAKELPRSVEYHQAIILAWLKWNLATVRAEHPDRGEPTEVILKSRYIPIPPPNSLQGWTGPVVERPYARWKLTTPPGPGYLPVEGVNPLTGESIRFRTEDNR